jgi:hypothetical protein
MTTEATATHSLTEILGRALIDPEMKERLLRNPDSIARQYDLSEQDRDALRTLDYAKLEAASGALSGRSEARISITIKGHFSTD